MAHVAQTRATLLAEFTEVESGRKTHRPALARALVDARACGAVLVIAKFDRLAHNVAFLSALMNGDVEFRALDLPGASRFHLDIMAAVAEKEATDASERTKAALAIARARGTTLGTPANLTDLSRRRSLAARQARAADRHRLTLPLVLAWSQLGWSLQQMAGAAAPDPRAAPAGDDRVTRVIVTLEGGPRLARFRYGCGKAVSGFVEILEEPLDTVPSRELGRRHGFTRSALDGRPSMR